MENNISGEYDKVIKETLDDVVETLINKVLKISYKKKESFILDMQVTNERKPDFLLKLHPEKGDPFVLHIEFQTDNDPNMPGRMLLYRGFIKEKHKLLARQYVIYIGLNKLKMENELIEENLSFKYHLVDMERIACESFLDSDNPAENVLGILCDFKDKDRNKIVRNILANLSKIDSKLLRLKYIKQLEVLSKLRNLQSVVKEEEEKMAIEYDMESDFRFMQGELRGKIKTYDKLLDEGIITEEKYKIEVEPLKKKLDELSRSKN